MFPAFLNGGGGGIWLCAVWGRHLLACVGSLQSSDWK